MKNITSLVEEAYDKLNMVKIINRDQHEYCVAVLTTLAEKASKNDLKPLPKAMPEWFVTYFNNRGNDAATCWSHMVVLFGTQQSNLQPLPESPTENFIDLIRGAYSAGQIWEYVFKHFGTPPDEWWMGLKKGDKFVFENDIERRILTFDGFVRFWSGNKYLQSQERGSNGFRIEFCTPCTTPTLSDFLNTLTDEQRRMWEEVKHLKENGN